MVQDQDGDGGYPRHVSYGAERVRGQRVDREVRAVDGWGGTEPRRGGVGGRDSAGVERRERGVGGDMGWIHRGGGGGRGDLQHNTDREGSKVFLTSYHRNSRGFGRMAEVMMVFGVAWRTHILTLDTAGRYYTQIWNLDMTFFKDLANTSLASAVP